MNFNDLMNIKITQVNFLCNKHGNVIANCMTFPDGKQQIECPECEAEKAYEIDEETKNKFQQQEREREIERYQELNIEKEFWDKDFENYKAESDSQKKAFEAVKDIVENKTGKVILLGSNGVGKTMLGSIAAKKLGGKIYSMYEISTMIRQSYTTKAEKTELEIVKELATIPFLAIDELGRTKGSDVELNWLSYVLDKRHVRGLPFMLMSNTHLKSKCPNHGCSQCFENFINNDILSRLRQNTKIINVDGKDFRAIK